MYLDDSVLDIAPVGDRAVLFYSDLRSPHEVLKANSPRYAITLWFREGLAGAKRDG